MISQHIIDHIFYESFTIPKSLTSPSTNNTQRTSSQSQFQFTHQSSSKSKPKPPTVSKAKYVHKYTKTPSSTISILEQVNTKLDALGESIDLLHDNMAELRCSLEEDVNALRTKLLRMFDIILKKLSEK